MELTPKEKANDLFSTFFRTGHNIEYEVEKAYAKRNSLLCVDEQITSLTKPLIGDRICRRNIEDEIEYLNNVKIELRNI